MMKQKRTSPGPDGLPYWLWKDYAHYLAPVLTKVLNISFHEQHVPSLWKLANISPIQKDRVNIIRLQPAKTHFID